MHEGLIVGIDAGMTSAYAILNLNGELVSLNSKRDFGINRFVCEICPYGRIIAIASDVAAVPKFVLDVAKKLRTTIIKPDKRMGMQKKRQIVKDFNKEFIEKTKNKHEIAALAAAIIAYKHFSSLINKIKGIEISDEKKTLLLVSLITGRYSNIKTALANMA